MTVFRQPNGKWRAQPYYKGRRIADEGGFDRRTDAKDWHDEQLALFKKKGAPVKAATFEELLEHFKTWHLPSVRPGTKRRYLVDIDQRIAPYFRFYALKDITPRMIEAFKAEVATKLSPKSVNNCLHTLRLMFNRAEKWRMIGKDESPYEVDSLAIPEAPYVWWEKEEHIHRFLQAARSSRYYPIYLLALETGLRYGEILGLSPKDIDLQSGTIHVHRQWNEKEGGYGPPKHGRGRHVDFNPKSELARVLKVQIVRANGEILFPTATGRRPAKSGVAHKYFRAAIRRAQVPRIPFHGLRHTMASWYMRRHDDVWALMGILGHSNIKTTMRYAHHSKRAKRKPLDLASVVTHESHTGKIERHVTGENLAGKEWRDGRDSNPHTPRLVS